MGPMKGISDKNKISILGNEVIVFPTNGAPAKPVNPVAKIVNPSPVATWLVIKLIVKNEKIVAINIPESAPAIMPK